MKIIKWQTEMLKRVSECQKIYDRNLKNKKVMFIYEKENRTLEKEEMFFGARNFYHLTGLLALDNKGNELTSNNFYNLLAKGRIDKMKIKRKDNTTDLKLQVLPQLMKIDKNANMIGDYLENNIFLQTEKIAGNVNACMGFIYDNKAHVFIPNTALKMDIRKITNKRARIIAILKKDVNEKLYQHVTYIKQQYDIMNIINREEIKEFTDIENIYLEKM